uniref:Uncharacterized protein n=1 Tax=Macaca fascicularis TaxID=9541 RepID=A0A7N9CZ50_MACFA
LTGPAGKQLTFLVCASQNHNGLRVTASCSEWRRNVVARQVPEASAELCSRNQPWAAATPSSLHPSPQPGLVEGTPTNLNRTLPSGIRGSQPLPPGQPPIPGRSSWETMTREPIPPHPQQDLRPGRLEGSPYDQICGRHNRP